MPTQPTTAVPAHRDEIVEMRTRLWEAEETIRAIRQGEVDAVLVGGLGFERVYTLEGADHAYKVLVERMNEGAASVDGDGTILYCNSRLAKLLGGPVSAVIGSDLISHFDREGRDAARRLLAEGFRDCCQGEFRLRTGTGSTLPVQVSLAPLAADGIGGLCVVITDLSLRESNEEVVRSERLARSILEQVGEAIVVCDRGGRVTRLSEAAGRLAGVDVLGRSFDDVFPLLGGPEGTANGSWIWPALSGEQHLGREATLRRHGEEVVDLVVNTGPLRGAEGEVLGCVVSLTDTTVQKRALEELRAAKGQLEVRVAERTAQLSSANARLHAELEVRARVEAALRRKKGVLRSVFDSMADAVIVAEESDGLVVCNPAASRMFGIGAAGLGLNEWFELPLLFPSDGSGPLPPEASPLWRAMHGEDVNAHELYVRPPDSPEGLWASVSARPIRDPDGSIRGGVVVHHDITESRQAEQDLRLRSQELARSNAELEQFAYVASHDLQEPLRMVGSFTQLLARRYAGQLDDKADQYIAFAVDGVSRMQRLIKDLLDFSRAGTRVRSFQPVDCERVLLRCVADLRTAIEEAGATVTHDPLPTVSADASQLGQLFLNLLGNALKFRSGAPCQVHVTAEKGDRAWTFCVRDNGIGIDPLYHDRVFVLFQRLHSRDAHPGTGIGLSICKKIVERHDGRIWFDSALGEGARIYFTLPEGSGR